MNVVKLELRIKSEMLSGGARIVLFRNKAVNAITKAVIMFYEGKL